MPSDSSPLSPQILSLRGAPLVLLTQHHHLTSLITVERSQRQR